MPETMATVRDLAVRGLQLRSLREGVDTTTPAGHMVAGVLASLAEVDDEDRATRTPRRDARSGRRPASGSGGRPRALAPEQIDAARRMRADGKPMPAIAQSLGVSRATLYRTLATKGGDQ